jgi:elongator complex protein 2
MAGVLIQTASSTISVLLDAVLSGHEDWVYSVAWRPAAKVDGRDTVVQPMELLTASMDRTTVLWAPVEETATGSGEGLWTSRARMGEMGVRV